MVHMIMETLGWMAALVTFIISIAWMLTTSEDVRVIKLRLDTVDEQLEQVGVKKDHKWVRG